MRLSHNRVRFRKRISFLKAIVPLNSTLILLFLLQFMFIFFGVEAGEVITSLSASSSTNRNSLSFNLAAFMVIYSAFPHFATSKSIRHGKEVEEDEELFNITTTTTLPSISPPTIANLSSMPLPSLPPLLSAQQGNSTSVQVSSRTLLVDQSDENATATTISPSEEMEMNLDSSEEERKRKAGRKKGINRLKRQMGMAAEIALIAPALQTMGCIPKFVCGLNSKPPTQESSVMNDLAYLIKFAMLDDDEVDSDDPIFGDKATNTRGKDGLTRVKEDLIIENMAEEELIQEDPANLPFVWSDMENRIKTKPGNKFRVEDVMDEIIVEPEQTAVGSLFTGIKSVLRIGRRRRDLEEVVGQGNESSQATPRSGRNRGSMTDAQLFRRRRLRGPQRFKKQPFWTSPKFRQDMELAERIGKTEQDEGKCSTTFSVCPYTTNEMMDIVHGGYKKKKMKQKKQQTKPQWYVNSEGPPPESSEETEEKSKRKPFYDPENLVTTTTEKTKWYPTDPENQIYYSIFPHKALEQGMTTIPTTTRRPHVAVNNDDDDDDEQPETVYDIGPRREHRKPPINIQGHVEYENDEGSFEGKKPEHLDVMMHNKKNHQLRQPPRKQSWWSLGGGGKVRPQRPPHQHSQNAHGQVPGRRPPHQGMGGEPHQHSNHDHSGEFDGGNSREESNKSGNDEEEHESSSEEQVKRKRKKQKNKKGGGSASESIEGDDDNGSSEEKSGRDEGRRSTTTPAPTPPQAVTSFQLPIELQGGDPNIQIISIQQIQSEGDLVPTGMPQRYQSPQPLQPFFHDGKTKQQPIALPRPKYKIQKENKQKKRRKFNQASTQPGIYGSQPQQHQEQHQEQHVQAHYQPKTPEPSEKEDKSNEESEEDEEEDEEKESQENSSEEKAAKDEESPPASPPPPQLQGRPHISVMLHGRPSEELKEPPNQHRHTRPHPGNTEGNQPQTSASAEDDLDNSDEDNRNSNSAGVEPTSSELSREMANLPQPARPPAHQFRRNSSSEYTYSDENHGRPSNSMRPINYSYFNKHPRDESPQNGGPPAPPPPPQGQHQTHPPPSTTQKYSTGFMSFLFGKNKQKKRPANGNNMRPHQQQQQQHSQSPNNSEEEPNNGDDDDDDIDDSRSSEERDTQPTFTAPEGKYEIGHLENKLPPKSIKADFKPPQKPQRPYRGSTSMEDSDEKRGRSTPAPPTSQQNTMEPTRPVILLGNSHKFIIPPPAIPPQRYSPTSPTTIPPTTKKPNKDSEEENDPESDEQKASEESREDDDDENSSEESDKKFSKKKVHSSPSSKGASRREPIKASVPVPPIANFHSGAATTAVVPSTTTKPNASKSQTKNRADYGGGGGGGDFSDEKQADDSNQTKEDDSAEEDVKISKEDSGEDGSSEEQEKKKRPPPPSPPKRRPEDDELDHPSSQFPPQLPVGGDIAAVEQILGAHNQDNENDEDYPEPYGLADNIPAAPPLQAVGFAPSLEILVPTNAPPLQVPPGVPLTEFYQGNNPVAAPGGAPPGPGQQLAPVNPTSLLGLAQQAGGNNNNNPPGAHGSPSEQAQQGIRNPGTGQSNRGPGSNNRRPGQGQQNNQRPQQGNNQQGGKEDSEENSSEENKNKTGEDSSEEEKEPKGNDGGFDEAILSVGQRESEDEDDDEDKPEKDKGPPSPPPIFTGSAEQKLELQKKRPFLPRPITPRPSLYTRPKPGRREPILKHQLKPNQLLQLHHPQQVHPPPMKKPHNQHSSPQQQYPHFVLPMRPSAAANLKPLTQQQRPPGVSQSFSVSHLLRPLLPRPVMKTRKPLDPKVVQWIKESYGIPDLNNMQGPNRSGLQSEDATKTSTTTTKSPSKSKGSKKAEKPERKINKTKVSSSSSEQKTTTVKSKLRGSAERRASDEVTSPATTTTTTTSTKTPYSSFEPATTTTAKSPSSLAPPKTTMTTTTTTSTTTAKLETKKPSSTTSSATTPSPSHKKISPDYISENEESEMAQALFDSSEEEEIEEEEKDSSEEDEEEEATTKINKSKIKTKVGNQKLVITIKSVVNKTRTASTSGERAKITSDEKVSKLGKYSTKNSSAEKKKPLSREKNKKSSKEASSRENKRKHLVKSKSSEVNANRKTSSSAEQPKRKLSSSKPLSSSAEVKQIIANFGRSTPRPRPKPIKLPPIYGKHSHRRTG